MSEHLSPEIRRENQFDGTLDFIADVEAILEMPYAYRSERTLRVKEIRRTFGDLQPEQQTPLVQEVWSFVYEALSRGDITRRTVPVQERTRKALAGKYSVTGEYISQYASAKDANVCYATIDRGLTEALRDVRNYIRADGKARWEAIINMVKTA